MQAITSPPVQSIFDIAGRTENALTLSFGVLLRRDRTLLTHFLTRILGHPFRLRKQDFDGITFRFERTHKEGRVDIEIQLENRLHVIVESKIHTNHVGTHQADRYATVLEKEPAKEKCFVFMTEVGNLDISDDLKRRHPSIRFANFGWQESLELLQRRKVASVNLVEEYRSYLLGARKMKICDIDIWAVVVRGKQVKNFDERDFYLHGQRHSPVFIGKREWDKTLRRVVVRVLRPVLEVHDKDSQIGRKNGRVYVYELGKPLVLTRPLVNKFAQTSAISVPFGALAIQSE